MNEANTVMTLDVFWELIEDARLESPGDLEKRGDLLHDELFTWKFEHVQQFCQHLGTQTDRAFHWDLWAAMWVYGDDGSLDDDPHYFKRLLEEVGVDETFDAFRLNLVAQGRTFFEQVIADPDRLAELPEEEELLGLDAHEFGHEISEVLRRKSKSPIRKAIGIPSREDRERSDQPAGVRPVFADVPGFRHRFPRIHARFSS